MTFVLCMLKVAYSPIYKFRLPAGHRFPMEKYDLLAEQLLWEGTLREENLFHPEMLQTETALLTHTEDWWTRMNELRLTEREIRTIGFPINETFVRRGRHISQGTLECALYALQYGCSMNIAGGTHHAFADRGEGFCCFNDQAVAANYLLENDLAKRILIVDLDVHQGNGTASIFKNEARVFTFSMHGEKNYPLRKEKSDLDINLPDGLDDESYLKTLNNHLPRVTEAFQPDFIFYLSGVDVLETDKLGRLALSRDGCRRRDKTVLEFCKRNQLPVAVSMGGGYSPKIADIVEAHANTFREAMQVFF
ncbi:MAG: histone deacetylase [Saprospiraceae bacterium]